MSKEAMKLALEALESCTPGDCSTGHVVSPGYDEAGVEAAIIALREALNAPLAEQPAQQEPVATDWERIARVQNAKLMAMCDEPQGFEKLCEVMDRYERTSPPAQQHDCSRSHPHENMDAMCKLRTEIARLTNENARLKARHQDDEINTYRMTLLCIRDGLQQGMSKSIQKLQAREINDVLGLPSFASYRTSPPNVPPARASKPWVGLTQQDINIAFDDTQEGGGFDDFARAIEAKLREKNAQPSKPLTDEQIIEMYNEPRSDAEMLEFARAIEAAHGIKEKNT